MDQETTKDLVAEQTEDRTWINKVIPVGLRPYLLCTFCSFCIAGFSVVSKVGLNKGMSLYVLTAYACVFATPSTAILAILFERKNKSKITFPLAFQISLLGLSAVLGRIFYYAGMQCTSATFAGAMLNLVPSATFILATICRMEKVNLLELSGQAKVGGTIVAFGGATLMTLYKGLTLIKGHNHVSSKNVFDGNLIKGSFFLILQCCFYAFSYVLQSSVIKKFPAPMTLTALNSLAATPIAIALAAALDHSPSSWRVNFDITLIAPIYCGVMVYGIANYCNTLVLPVKGPVFVTAFFPFTTLIITVMGLLILHETLHLGGVVGATLIIIGLYALLWGKEREKRKLIIPEPPLGV